MIRPLIALTVVYLFAAWNVPMLGDTDVQSAVLYAPQPDYPTGALDVVGKALAFCGATCDRTVLCHR
jgi:hypothetical protein